MTQTQQPDACGRREDWTDCMDLLAQVRRLRFLILFLSVAPPVLFLLYSFYKPADSRLTVCWPQPEMTYSEFLLFRTLFYNTQNLQRIAQDLSDPQDLPSVRRQIDQYRKNPEALAAAVEFEIWPDLEQGTSKNGSKNQQQIPEDPQTKLYSFNVILRGKDREFLSRLSDTVSSNLSNDLVLEILVREIKGDIRTYRNRLAAYEKERTLQQEHVDRRKALLASLKELPAGTGAGESVEIPVEFNLSTRSEYLPLSFHIRALEYQILELETDLAAQQAEYERNRIFLQIHLDLLARLESDASPIRRVSDYRDLLEDRSARCTEDPCRDLLAASLKKAENLLVRNPPCRMGFDSIRDAAAILKKTARLFLACLLGSLFLVLCLNPVHPHAKPTRPG